MKLTILGCYSATPRANAHPTSQVLEIKNELFLIDCGEGTQTQLRRHHIKFSRLKHIFISHLHGDHVFGLIGLISSFSLLHREKELHVHGPKGLKKFITTQLNLTKSWTSYPLYFHELNRDQPGVIYEDKKVAIENIPLDHRIYANGYLFKEKPGDRKLLIDKVKQYDIDVAYYNSIKKGKDITLDSGQVIPNKKLTAPPPLPKSYAFCSDTAYKPDITTQIAKVTALYHESTFQEDNKDLCEPTKHSTAKQAATIAKKADAKQLILGHYSSRYDGLEDFKKEAQTVFQNIKLAEDGKVFDL